MIKLRLYFTNDEEGKNELDEALEKLEKNFDIIYKSNTYKDRGASNYARVYLEVKNKR